MLKEPVPDGPPAPADDDDRPWDEATADEVAAQEAHAVNDADDPEDETAFEPTPSKKPLRIRSVDADQVDQVVDKLAPSTRALLEERFRARYLGTREADAEDIF
ncbi:MAG: hypothetical protein ACFB20_03460 [Opitutales bacterium]